MATIRRAGFGTVFELEDSKVGIGTDAATHTLQALGNFRSKGVEDVGVSTLSTYQGFVDQKSLFLNGECDFESQSGTISGKILIDGDVTVSSATTFTSGLQHLTVTDTFTLPSGDTNSREEKPTPGSFRFNQDLATLEFYTGNNWATVNTFTEMQNSPGNRGRAIIHLASTGTTNATLDFLNISTFGNSQSFGNLTEARFLTGRSSSETRGLFAGGDPGPSNSDIIDYITMASSGNAIDFGNLTASGRCPGGASSSTRAIFAGVNSSNVISYVEINTLGDALDFGDLTNVAGNRTASFSSPTRFVCMSGHSSPNQGVIDFLNIASKGNTVRFGNITFAGEGYGSAKMNRGLSNSTRGLFAGGYQPNSPYPVVSFIDYVTIASEGNATNFGDMTSVRYNNMTTGSQTRGILAGGQGDQPTFTREKTIDSVEYATTGTAVHFGELSVAAASGSANSDSHGGLGGF